METSIKISNIQSLQDTMQIKQEKEPVEESTIKIRTISEINQSPPPPQIQKNNVFISKQHPSQQILSKHIVVRKVPNSPVTTTKTPQMTRVIAANGSNVIKGPFPEIVAKPPINYTVPPALEAYIKQLEDENKEMKKVLMECRKEAVAIQMRTHKLTNIINATVAKCNAKRPLSGLKQPIVSTPPPQLPVSSQQPHQVQQNQMQSTQSSPTQLMQRKQFKVLPRKGNNVTAKGNIVCRVPVFPISRLQILKQLELDLSKKEFSEYVFQKLYNVNNKSDIDKPSILLNNTLNSIIDPKLMGQFEYEALDSNINSEYECEYFKALQRVRVLYGKLVNALSNTIFAKSVDMVALEKFVKNKISAHRNEYLATMERLKSSKIPIDNTANTIPTIKMEKLEPEDIKPVMDNLRWLSEEEDVPMHSEKYSFP